MKSQPLECCFHKPLQVNWINFFIKYRFAKVPTGFLKFIVSINYEGYMMLLEVVFFIRGRTENA